MTECHLCTHELLHCHSTAVVHEADFWECSDSGCTLTVELHEIVVDCHSVDPQCRCGMPSGSLVDSSVPELLSA